MAQRCNAAFPLPTHSISPFPFIQPQSNAPKGAFLFDNKNIYLLTHPPQFLCFHVFTSKMRIFLRHSPPSSIFSFWLFFPPIFVHSNSQFLGLDIFGSNSEKSVEYGTAELLPPPSNRFKEADDERRGPNSVGSGGPPPTGVYNSNLENNMTRILNSLIASHDRRIRPNFGGPPTIVNVTIHVITISAISEVSMDYTLDLYLRQFWHDSRLAFAAIEGHDNLTVGIDMVKSIWTPDTFFPNEKKSYFHETTSHNSFLRIDSKGNVIRSIRLTVTANCPMSLHTFPLDKQICPLEIESYGYSTSDIIYHWQSLQPVTIDDDVHLAHFSVGGFHQVERTISLSTGNYSRLTAFFTFKRNLGFYLIQIYFPSSLIVVISWVSFFLNREATQARVTIGVTTVLTQTTLMTSTNASLPKVSYVKSLDIFLGVCFFIVFASLLEYAAVGFLMKRQRHKNASTSLLPRSSTATVCFYELEDGTVRMNPAPTANPPLPENNLPPPKRFKRTTPPSRKCSAILMTSNGGPEQSIPLLGLSPQHTAGGPRQSVTSGMQVPGPNRQSLSFYLPEEAVHFALTGEEPNGGRGRGCKIRPSQVDLFSRIAFPIFFILFHLAYWLVYLNLNFE